MINKLGKVLDKIGEANIDNEGTGFNTFSFTSLNNGAGAKTVASQIAYLLASENERVCLIDCDLISPCLGYMMNTIIGRDESVIGYTNFDKELNEVLIKVKGINNLWLISASPADRLVDVGRVNKKHWNNLIKNVKSIFDFVIINLNYNPFAEWFVHTLPFIDKGFIVVDEQIETILKTKYFLSFVHSISNKAGALNNIIVNKCTDNPFEISKYKDIECNIICELPFKKEIMVSKNEGKIYLKSSGASNEYIDGVKEIVREISREIIKG